MNATARTAATLAALLLLVGFAPSGHATEYAWGNWKCRNFEKAAERYEEARAESQKPERHDAQGNLSASFMQFYRVSQATYAICLVLRGENENPSLVAAGMQELYYMVKWENWVPAAFFQAEYIRSGGKLDSSISPQRIDSAPLTGGGGSAIEQYFKVLQLINHHAQYAPGYPGRDEPHDHAAAERRWQMELTAWYYVPRLYMEKFYLGFAGHENFHDGGIDPEAYHNDNYIRHTRDSLEKTVEYADRCIDLPNKGHFAGQTYTDFTAACRVLKEAAQLLLPLDWEARGLLPRGTQHSLLSDTSCQADPLRCERYAELSQKVAGIYDSMVDELNAIDSVGRAGIRYAEDMEGPGGAGTGTTAAAALTPKCEGLAEGAQCWQELANKPGCYIYAWNDHPYHDQQVEWTGQCSGGVAVGKGELTWRGSKWSGEGTGEVRDGKPHGRWVWRDPDVSMEGHYVDGEEHGRWVMRWHNGHCVWHEYSNGKAVGNGDC